MVVIPIRVIIQQPYRSYGDDFDSVLLSFTFFDSTSGDTIDAVVVIIHVTTAAILVVVVIAALLQQTSYQSNYYNNGSDK